MLPLKLYSQLKITFSIITELLPKCVINFLLLLIQQKKLLWVILIGGPQNYHFTWGPEKNFFHSNKQKNWVNRVWITKIMELTSMLILHLLFIKTNLVFLLTIERQNQAAEGRHRRISQDLAGSTTHGSWDVPEKILFRTHTSLPPRRPLKTKWGVYHLRGKSFFFLKIQAHAFLLPTLLSMPTRVHTQ